MAKVQSFADKSKKKDGEQDVKYVKMVYAVDTDKGSKRFQSKMVAVTPDNEKEIFG
jgi:hypothetical protein